MTGNPSNTDLSPSAICLNLKDETNKVPENSVKLISHNSGHQFNSSQQDQDDSSLHYTEDASAKPNEKAMCCQCFWSPPHKWTPLTLIFILCFFGHWGDRKWMFTAGVLLVHLSPSSLRLVAVYYAVISIMVLLFAAPLGSWIDTSPRRRAALVCLAVQNISVAVSGGCFLVLLLPQANMSTLPHLTILLTAMVVLSAGVAVVASTGCQACLTKDWLVEVCCGDPGQLARANATTRAIDLGTEVLAPVAAGYIMLVWGASTGAGVIVGWNIISLVVEAMLYLRVYNLCLALQVKKPKAPPADNRPSGCMEGLSRRMRRTTSSWRAYAEQPVALAGVALACLYMTVLSMGNYCRAYLYESGVNEALLGVFTAASSVPGLIASLLFPFLRKKLGLECVGLLGLTWQAASLTLCVVSVFTPGSLFHLVVERDVLQNNTPSAAATTTPAYGIGYGNNEAVINDGTETLGDNTKATTPFNFAFSKGDTTGSPLLRPTLISPTSSTSNYSFFEDENRLDSKYNARAAVTFSPRQTTPDLYARAAVTSESSSDSVTIASGGRVPGVLRGSTSVALLVTGIIVSRFGLWLIDLSVVQSTQELVAQEHRGAISGVQSSMNMMFDLLRSSLLMAFPRMDTFGYLILVSVVFVYLGLLTYWHFFKQRKAVLKVQKKMKDVDGVDAVQTGTALLQTET